MTKMKKSLYITLTAALMVGCVANVPVEPSNTSEQICFNVPVPATTKTALTDISQIQNSATTAVFIYGKRGTSQINSTYYEGGQIYYNATGIWGLNYGTTTWQSGANYTFWGWAYSPTNATSNGSLTLNNNGLNAEVAQPSSYSESGTVDYMLAHKFYATATSTSPVRGPIVTLEMEHALSMIEIYVLKNPNMYDVAVSNITISNFYLNGSITSTNQATYGDGARNLWTLTTSGANDASYSIGGVMTATDDRTTTEAAMKFIAVPQQLSAATTLSFTCQTTEREGGTPSTQTKTYQLYNYDDWESGYRNIYILTVDTSIHFYATIKEWPTVSYVNGTLLPEIK